MELTQREKMIIKLEAEYQITIIFNNQKTVICNRCKENMAFFNVLIDEHLEFECCYCGKNVKLPLYLWNNDIYQFPNDFYNDSVSCKVEAQCLAQAYNLAYNINKKLLMKELKRLKK